MINSYDKYTESVFGPNLFVKHIILLKLVRMLEQIPSFGNKYIDDSDSIQQKWISETRALIYKMGHAEQIRFNNTRRNLRSHWSWALNEIRVQMNDIVEEIKLDLELDGKNEIGAAYGPGEIYKYFSDLKGIIKNVNNNVFLIDPYFDGNAFDTYFSDVSCEIQIDIFTSFYSDDLIHYLKKYSKQNDTTIEVRTLKGLHDRVIVLDNDNTWVSGSSVKDAGKKPTYLLPLDPEISSSKIKIYRDLWDGAKVEFSSEN